MRKSMRVKKAAAILISLLLLAGVYMTVSAMESLAIEFADPQLETALAREIGKRPGTITFADMKKLQTLVISQAEISNLDGLQYATNLVELHLAGNRISDLSPLKKLKHLQVLNLRDNLIDDISDLGGMLMLRDLNLRNNFVSDLGPIGNLIHLETLNVRDNEITDLSPLRNLRRLTDVNLRNNRITSVKPLDELPNITRRLYLNGNEIADLELLGDRYRYIEATDFFTPEYTGIPIVYIDTNGVDIISKTRRVPGTMTIVNSENSNYPEEGLYAGKIGIQGRGNSSWSAPKKPYNIELWDDYGQAIDAQILDMPSEEDWLLIPNYYDKSLMRNYIAYDLAWKLGMAYAPRARYVEVYLNGEYMGNYLLVEKIKQDNNRVRLHKLSDRPEDQVEPNITGGYLLRIDRIENHTSWEYFISKYQRTPLIYEYPKVENLTKPQRDYIEDYINQFEKALYSNRFDDPETGYAKYIDVDSFIDWYIIHELSRDVDAWRLSTYMYKDRFGKLTMGPVWDFDIAFGNANYDDGWRTDGWGIVRTYKTSWYRRLFQDPAFADRVIERWREVKPIIDRIPETIDATAEFLKESADRNFKRWDILGRYVWPNVEPFPETYQGEVDRLKEWIVERTAWIDRHIEELRP